MNIFITGTTGFIGSNLALKLAESGHTVHALYRTAQKTSIIQHKNIKIFKGDILDRKSLQDAMMSCSQVYHLGAFARVRAKKYLHDWAVSSEKAQEELGYSVTPLNTGIEKTIEWLKGGDII